MNLGIRVLRLAVIGCLTVVASLVGVSAEAITIAPNLCQGTSLTNCPNPDTGAIAPNSGTWIQADITGAGTVHVDMFGVLGTQAVDIWWFNLNPSVTGTLALTNFTFISGNGLTAPTLTTNLNQNVNGGGQFDVSVNFATALANRFDDADHFSFDITCTAGAGTSCAGFSADSFNVFNNGSNETFIRSPDGTLIPSGTPFRTIAHVINCGECGSPNTGGSVWIAGAAGATVPEPATLILLGSGLVGLGVVARRGFRK